MIKVSARIEDKLDNFITLEAKKIGLTKSEFIREAIKNKSNISLKIDTFAKLQKQILLFQNSIDQNTAYIEKLISRYGEVKDSITLVYKLLDKISDFCLIQNQLMCQLLTLKYSPEKVQALIDSIREKVLKKEDGSNDDKQK